MCRRASRAGGNRRRPHEHGAPRRVARLILDLAARRTDDGFVLAALRAHGIPPARDAWFDAVGATFFLGARQARIVRDGKVVRIPAGTAHRYENTGDGPLHAVAVHGAPTIVTQQAAR